MINYKRYVFRSWLNVLNVPWCEIKSPRNHAWYLLSIIIKIRGSNHHVFLSSCVQADFTLKSYIIHKYYIVLKVFVSFASLYTVFFVVAGGIRLSHAGVKLHIPCTLKSQKMMPANTEHDAKDKSQCTRTFHITQTTMFDYEYGITKRQPPVQRN